MQTIYPHKKQVCLAYALMRVLDTPFWGLFNLLIFILYKDLSANPLQLGLMITLKPLVSLLSSYWANWAAHCGWRLTSTLLLARTLAFLPFLFFPFIENIWLIIASSALFMFLQSGMMPAWMELLHKNVPQHERDTLFSYTQAFGYLGGGLLPFIIGWALDEWDFLWRLLFAVFALVALTAQFRLYHVNTHLIPSEKIPTDIKTHPVLHPWKNALFLLLRRRDFAKFQCGFMFLGAGLMIIQPALPPFFVDKLNLSYTEMGVAITLCKGIAFALASPLWIKWIRNIDFFKLSATIALLAALFPLLLFSALYQNMWLFIAYLIYGSMQSGNELCWNMSGPIFAAQENSSLYSSVNVIAVGVRGLVIPSLGALLLAYFGSSTVLSISCILCLLGSFFLFAFSKSENIVSCPSKG